MKRILALTSLWLFAAVAVAQAPIGVCINNVAQTISNGVIAPIPYATVALCTPGSTAANCVANKVNIFTSTGLSTATPTNPFTSDSGGNYYFCAHVGHYGLLINSSYGQYFVPDVTLTDNWAAGGTMTGTLTDTAGFVGPLTGNVAGNVSGNAGTSSASDHSPTQCGSGLYSQGDTTVWAANCSQVLWNQIGGVPALVTSFNTRTGAVTLTATDVDAVGNITNNTSGNAATATAFAATPSNCGAGQSAYGISANGTALCNSRTPRTSGTNGYYAISDDGTITEWIFIGALNNNTPTTITIPHAITTLMSVTCTDNSSRVSSGNNQPIGAAYNSSTSIIVNTPATGVSAYCTLFAF